MVAVTQTIADYDIERDTVEIDGIRCTSHARTPTSPGTTPIATSAPSTTSSAEGTASPGSSRRAARVPARGPWRRAVARDLARRRDGGRLRDSWFERLVEECLRSSRLPRVERQFEVRGLDGALIGRVDLAFPSLRLAVEAHSRQFHTGPAREAFDQRRDNELATEGWHTTYVGWTDANSTPAAVRRTMERIVARRADDLGIDLRSLLNARAPGTRALSIHFAVGVVGGGGGRGGGVERANSMSM